MSQMWWLNKRHLFLIVLQVGKVKVKLPFSSFSNEATIPDKTGCLPSVTLCGLSLLHVEKG